MSDRAPARQPVSVGKQGFLRHIHYFRAVAILFVVLGHVFLVPWSYTGFRHPVYNTCFLIFANGTVFFVLISGFLFQHINDNSGFQYGPLLRKKFLFIYVPMLVMSLPAMVGMLFAAPGFSFSKLAELAIRLPLGQLLEPYWYIPFIMLVFAVSPFIRKFIRLPGSLVITLITVLVCFFFFPRTPTLWPGVIPYFLPLFVLGSIMSYRYDRLQGPITRGVWWWALLAAAGLAACLFLPSEMPRYFVRCVNVSCGAGLQSLCFGCFKLFLALFFWGLLMKWEHREIKLLDWLATYSFGIYFIHSYFLSIGLAAYTTLWPTSGLLLLPVTLAYCVLVPLVSLGIAMLIKRLLPRYSRYIEGV